MSAQRKPPFNCIGDTATNSCAAPCHEHCKEVARRRLPATIGHSHLPIQKFVIPPLIACCPAYINHGRQPSRASVRDNSSCSKKNDVPSPVIKAAAESGHSYLKRPSMRKEISCCCRWHFDQSHHSF